MTVTYYDLGGGRCLHEVVFAGTHDSGITGGAANAQTQDRGIYGQADAGSRIFDLRVAAHATGAINGRKIVKLQAYHADSKLMKNETKTRELHRTGASHQVTRTKLRGGEWGMGLTRILQEAQQFVADNPTEFLLLKFDKCKNYGLIADACVDLLGASLYTAGGNLNRKTLFDLQGKVIVLFPQAGLIEMGAPRPGILKFRNLSSFDDPGGAYQPVFEGLQYHGKGGTNAMNMRSHGYKTRENAKKQAKLMNRGASSMYDDAPEVLGMMYWTTTGLSASIQTRDAYMWEPKRRSRLAQLWRGGLDTAITSRLPAHVAPTDYSASGFLKVFMPNFVMVDFMDAQKGAYIKSLNDIAAVSLTQQAIAQLDDAG